eukprot:CAMPEP_0115011516 /NCGR_PEP_ID=MMETSP0216-20121206/24054_1 /TAXON_ID=223996 /ORGANISM="Protocruzia adherens, Strain Boccale" /LENGTH=295 /DNA_ID=CAMNT_0002380129 /DNA_START=128 /DNA_END=1015 /DNA_ORIENTATION=+
MSDSRSSNFSSKSVTPRKEVQDMIYSHLSARRFDTTDYRPAREMMRSLGTSQKANIRYKNTLTREQVDGHKLGQLYRKHSPVKPINPLMRKHKRKQSNETLTSFQSRGAETSLDDTCPQPSGRATSEESDEFKHNRSVDEVARVTRKKERRKLRAKLDTFLRSELFHVYDGSRPIRRPGPSVRRSDKGFLPSIRDSEAADKMPEKPKINKGRAATSLSMASPGRVYHINPHAEKYLRSLNSGRHGTSARNVSFSQSQTYGQNKRRFNVAPTAKSYGSVRAMNAQTESQHTTTLDI